MPGTTSRRRPALADVIRIVVTVVLGGIGAAAGFKHTHDWAVHHGQTGWLAWADAVVIEGIAIVAGFELHREQHRPGPRVKVSFPMVVLVAGIGVQMAAQVALAEPTPAGWLLAAMPALGFLVVVKLLMRRTSDTDPAPVRRVVEQAPPPTPGPAPGAVGPPSAGTSLRLPAEVTERVAAVVRAVREQGREPTSEDIRKVARVPDVLASRILADLADHNGHPN